MRRRRFLTIAGSSIALAGIPAAPQAQIWEWRGTALGAVVAVKLVHHERAKAQRIIQAAVSELRRLERVFSLYRADSAVVALNREGVLADPPREMLELLALAGIVREASGGAFDVTVQPLWQLYASHFAAIGADPAGPDPRQVDRALAFVGYQEVDFGRRRIQFGKPGMAVTLNGIAQGYIADRIAGLFADAGIVGTLVDMGEIRALGARADGRPWRVGIEGVGEPLELHDRAVATSAPLATRFDAAGAFHHLLDPRTGRPVAVGPGAVGPGAVGPVAESLGSEPLGQVSVVARSAVLADAASTAMAILPRAARERLAQSLGVDRIITPVA